MEGAWAERASTLSDLLHTNPTGQTYGYFPACSSAVTQLFLLCHTDNPHSQQTQHAVQQHSRCPAAPFRIHQQQRLPDHFKIRHQKCLSLESIPGPAYRDWLGQLCQTRTLKANSLSISRIIGPIPVIIYLMISFHMVVSPAVRNKFTM